MKKTLILLFLILYTAPLDAQLQPTLIWDYETTSDPVCTPALLDDCVSAFEVFYYNLSGVPVSAVRVPAGGGSASGPIRTYSIPVPNVAGPKYIVRRWFVRAIGLSGGVEIVSEKSNELDVQQRPTPPKNLRGS